MILPTKHLQAERSLLNQGAFILSRLAQPQTVNALWGAARETPGVRSFDQFCLGLSFLFSIGIVRIEDGLVVRVA
jgi:hypothetical protein